MLLKYIFIFALVSQIFGTPIDDEAASNYAFENEILELFEYLRQIMKEGDPDKGIPPMEPLQLKGKEFDFTLEDTELKGAINETVIRHLSDFKVDYLNFTIYPRKNLTVAISFEQLGATGYYELFGTLFGEYPIKGLGTHDINVKGAVISASAEFRSKAAIIYIKHLGIDFNVAGISISYKNYLEDEEEKTLDEKLVLQIIDRFRVSYLPRLVNTLKIVLNDFLERLSTNSYINNLTE